MSAMCRVLCPPSLANQFSARLMSTWPEHRDVIRRIDWSSYAQLMRAVPPRIANAAWKTFAGGWTTSSRTNEGESRLCILGCGGRDCFKHYFSECQRFYLAWSATIACGLPACPISRFGVFADPPRPR
eukprot:9486498-Pyramimonas_sp.AAC.1